MVESQRTHGTVKCSAVWVFNGTIYQHGGLYGEVEVSFDGFRNRITFSPFTAADYFIVVIAVIISHS